MKTIQRSLVFLVVAVILFFLAGCQSVPVEKVVYKTKYVIVTVEDAYLKPTAVNPPPPLSVYGPNEPVDWEKEYKIAVDSLVTTYGAVGQCNADKNQARADILKKQKRYE